MAVGLQDARHQLVLAVVARRLLDQPLLVGQLQGQVERVLPVEGGERRRDGAIGLRRGHGHATLLLKSPVADTIMRAGALRTPPLESAPRLLLEGEVEHGQVDTGADLAAELGRDVLQPAQGLGAPVKIRRRRPVRRPASTRPGSSPQSTMISRPRCWPRA